MAGPNDPDSYERAEFEQRVRAGPNHRIHRHPAGASAACSTSSKPSRAASAAATGDQTRHVTSWRPAPGRVLPMAYTTCLDSLRATARHCSRRHDAGSCRKE